MSDRVSAGVGRRSFGGRSTNRGAKKTSGVFKTPSFLGETQKQVFLGETQKQVILGYIRVNLPKNMQRKGQHPFQGKTQKQVFLGREKHKNKCFWAIFGYICPKICKGKASLSGKNTKTSVFGLYSGKFAQKYAKERPASLSEVLKLVFRGGGGSPIFVMEGIEIQARGSPGQH